MKNISMFLRKISEYCFGEIMFLLMCAGLLAANSRMTVFAAIIGSICFSFEFELLFPFKKAQDTIKKGDLVPISDLEYTVLFYLVAQISLYGLLYIARAIESEEIASAFGIPILMMLTVIVGFIPLMTCTIIFLLKFLKEILDLRLNLPMTAR